PLRRGPLAVDAGGRAGGNSHGAGGAVSPPGRRGQHHRPAGAPLPAQTALRRTVPGALRRADEPARADGFHSRQPDGIPRSLFPQGAAAAGHPGVRADAARVLACPVVLPGQARAALRLCPRHPLARCRGAPDLIRERLTRLAWIFSEKFGLILLSMLSFFVFAHLLTPEELGVGVLIIVIVELVGLLFSSLIEDPLVRRPQVTPRQRATAFWACVVAGLGSLGVFSLGGLVVSD